MMDAPEKQPHQLWCIEIWSWNQESVALTCAKAQNKAKSYFVCMDKDMNVVFDGSDKL